MVRNKHNSLLADQRGISHILLGMSAVLILFMIVVIGVGVAKRSGQTASGSAAQTAQASDCLKEYQDNELCLFSANSDLIKTSYKMVATNTDANGTATFTYLSDGRGNASEADATDSSTTNSIFFSGVAYLKDDDGSWLKFARGDSNAPKNNNPISDVKFDTKTGKDESSLTYKKVAKEKCGQLTCLKYQLIDSTQPSANQHFWFDTKDYRLQRYVSKDGGSTFEVAVTYLPVRIKPPSPTKDFKPADDSSSSGDTSSNDNNATDY